MVFIRARAARAVPDACSECGGKMPKTYMPMEEWGIRGPLCGSCYSKLLARHYPGDHVRVNSD